MPTAQELRCYGLRGGNIGHQSVDCSICLSKVADPVVTSCRHVFCWECLLRWMSEHTSCPTCRSDLHQARMRQWSAQSGNLVGQIESTTQQRSIHASGTLEQGAFETSVWVPPVVNDRRSQYTTLADLQRQSSNASRYYPNAVLQDATDAASRGQNVQLGANASHNHTSTSRPQHQPSREQPPPNTGQRQPGRNRVATDAGDRRSGSGRSVTINPQRMVRAMSVRAEELADENGMRYYPGYMDAAKAVARHWTQVLGRRAGLTALEDDLMKILGDQMDVALADTGIVDFDRGERVPKALKRYLREVAQAAFDAQ